MAWRDMEGTSVKCFPYVSMDSSRLRLMVTIIRSKKLGQHWHDLDSE